MAFNTDTPQPLEAMRDSQPLFLDNFFELYQLFGVDHYNFDTAIIPSPNAGKHVKLTMTQQDATTIPAPDASNYLLFQALSALSGDNQLYSKTPAGALLEFSDKNVFDRIGVGFSGWTALPSGIIIKWATIQIRIDFKLALMPPPNNALTIPFSWATDPGQKAFTQQYWSYVTEIANNEPFNGSNNFSGRTNDAGFVTYIKSIADPTKVEFNVWLRNTFNNASPITNNVLSFPQNFNFLIVSIGA